MNDKYKLVPVEPTLEMMEAGAEGCGQDLDRDEARGRAFVAYKAMLAAAPDHIADSRKMVSDQLRGGTKKIGRPQIREVFLRNGFTIKPGCDDLRDYVYKAAFELLELAAPAVQVEPVGWHTEDHLDDKSATTYSAEVAQRWRDKGWPVWSLYTAPQPAPEVVKLVEALEEISDPIRFMRERLEEGEQLNGMAAVQLAKDAEYLRSIAKAALAAHRKGGEL